MSQPPRLEDNTLIQRISDGDSHALQLLYERYSSAVYGIAMQVLHERSLAEEATQDTFMKIWRGTARWQTGRGAMSSWLLTVARYTAIDRLRQEQRRTAESLDDVPEPPSDIGVPERDFFQDGRILRGLLTHIPPEQAQVVELAFFQGMTHRELATHLDLPLGTVKTRVRLALQKLKDLWLDEMQP